MILTAKKIKPGNSKKSIYEIISKCALNEKDEKKLMRHIKSLKAIFISTPFFVLQQTDYKNLIYLLLKLVLVSATIIR